MQLNDPFGLVPTIPESRPRVLCTLGDIGRIRRGLAGEQASPAWLAPCVARLRENTRRALDEPLGKAKLTLAGLAAIPSPSDPAVNLAIPQLVARSCLLRLITGEDVHLERAMELFRMLARAYPDMPITGHDNRAGGGALAESRFNLSLGRAYDLAEACGIGDADRALFRRTLERAFDTLDRCAHRTCGNHNSWSLAARVSVAVALGDREKLAGAIYGCPAPAIPGSPDTPTFRYGLAHQIRHDILADGMHWERTLGYHYYSTMALVEAAIMLGNCGADLWNTPLPANEFDDGFDLHFSYGPPGARKTLRSLFDAPFYQAFSNGDFSLLSDSGLANLRGVPIWGILYEAAYDATGDAKFAWLIHHCARESADASNPIPPSLCTHSGDFDFVRVRSATVPAGDFGLLRDSAIGAAGRHERGCSLFPQHGSAVLRANPADPAAAGLAMFFGPHNAGHQAPAALHLDLHARGTLLTCSGSERNGYPDPEYLSWCRTTIAHNTVTIDQSPMFPYDLGGESIWEADSWRRRRSDGVLENFQPEAGWSAVRASNQNVYPGVRLDRTCVVATDAPGSGGHGFVLDCFRCYAEAPHVYDYTMHLRGKLEFAGNSEAFDLGSALGYRHLTVARRLILDESAATLDLSFRDEKGVTRVCLLLPERTLGRRVSVIVIDENASGIHEKHRDKPLLGERPGDLSRLKSGLIVRVEAVGAAAGKDLFAGRAEFLSLWWFDDTSRTLEAALRRDGEAERVRVTGPGGAEVWELPFRSRKVSRGLAGA